MRNCLNLALVWALAIFASTAFADRPSDSDVIDNFLKHVESMDSLSAEQKAAARERVGQLRADEGARVAAITAGLASIYPQYDQAVAASESDDVQLSIKQLRPHVDSDDLYLASDASFLLARSLMNNGRHEEALPILEKLISELSPYTLHVGPATYFAGVAQANLLENQRAIQSFNTFLESYPKAPERLRVAAWRQIQMIQAIAEGGMEDVYQRMDFSHRRLELEKTGEVTQTQQEKIVSMLAKLIREQEKKECSSCNSKKNCEGQQESQSQQAKKDGKGKSNTGGTSDNPNGVARKTYHDGPASPWSRLRARSRDAANSAIKEKLPPRYRRVVEKYYEKTSGNSDDSGK